MAIDLKCTCRGQEVDDNRGVARRNMTAVTLEGVQQAMGQKPINRVIDTMNVIERASALRGMHQAMALGNLVDAIVSDVRGALSDAGHAMDLLYGRAAR